MEQKNIDNFIADWIANKDKLAEQRQRWDKVWQDIAELMRPMRQEYYSGDTNNKIFDMTAILASDQLASGLWGVMTNTANRWFSITHADIEINNLPEVHNWLNEVQSQMHHYLSTSGKSFYAKLQDLYADLVCFGTGIFYSEDRVDGKGIYYSSRSLKECYLVENEYDEVDTVYRVFSMPAHKAKKSWGNLLDKNILEACDNFSHKSFEFLHITCPMNEVPFASEDIRSKNYASIYIDLTHKKLIKVGGYWEFPYQIVRWSRAAQSVYGESPAMVALPDVRMLNSMSKTLIYSAQKQADPPILTVQEDVVKGIRATPGSVIYGGLDPISGRRLYEPLITGSNLNYGLELEAQRRAAIKEAFWFSLLLMTGMPNRTATEILLEQEEKVRLMAPQLGRIQSEFLDPFLWRQFCLMYRAKKLPKIPPCLKDDINLKFNYLSPLARVEKTAEAIAVTRFMDSVRPLIELQPSLLEKLNLEQMLEILADAWGAKDTILNKTEIKKDFLYQNYTLSELKEQISKGEIK